MSPSRTAPRSCADESKPTYLNFFVSPRVFMLLSIPGGGRLVDSEDADALLVADTTQQRPRRLLGVAHRRAGVLVVRQPANGRIARLVVGNRFIDHVVEAFLTLFGAFRADGVAEQDDLLVLDSRLIQHFKQSFGRELSAVVVVGGDVFHDEIGVLRQRRLIETGVDDDDGNVFGDDLLAPA